MKRAKVRIITNDVPRLRKFYQEVLGLYPIGDDRYLEFPAPGLTLAIASQQRMNMIAVGEIEPASNRSAIFDFEVEDIDQERTRLQRTIANAHAAEQAERQGNKPTDEQKDARKKWDEMRELRKPTAEAIETRNATSVRTDR